MHVAIIMDGNGRWAGLRGLPRTAGHHAGAKAVRRIVEAAAKLPIDVLTLYAFSCDNWSRPAVEVHGLFSLMKRYLQSESTRCAENGVAVEFIGRRDRFSEDLRGLIEHAEQLTAGGRALLLRVAADYSSRGQILSAVRRASDHDIELESFGGLLSQRREVAGRHRDVDLLIRTGGERRLSDFLLWESAYAELIFLDTCWPDFDEPALSAALEEFRRRDRRFGNVPQNSPSALVGKHS
jgi:undecaprenyl diphosphate synthase